MIHFLDKIKIDTIILTGTLLMLVGVIYFTQFMSSAGHHIEPGAIYAVSTAVLN